MPLMSLLCKLHQHIITKQMMNHIDVNHISKACQHGFRAMHSCLLQVLNFNQALTGGVSEEDQYNAHVMDFSKAFDRVSHA